MTAEAESLQQARRLTRALMKPDPKIYWADFLFNISLGWGLFALILFEHRLWFQAPLFVIAVLAFYRAAIFIHELAHLYRNRVPGFRLVWNLLCGIPFLVPSFSYDGVHNEHHKKSAYGTQADGEYLPFARMAPWRLVAYALLSWLLPVLFVVRFALLTPLSWVIPKLRPWLWRSASSLIIDPEYQRPVSAVRHDADGWRLQETCASIWAVTVLALVVTGVWPVSVLVLWYGVMASVFFLNSLRTLVAHAYRNPADQSVSVIEQFQDSIDVPGHWFWTALWAPVGLRFHATHHLFPSMPYHNLGKAHRLLVNELDDNRWYLAASRQSLCSALAQIWREAANYRQATR